MISSVFFIIAQQTWINKWNRYIVKTKPSLFSNEHTHKHTHTRAYTQKHMRTRTHLKQYKGLSLLFTGLVLTQIQAI